MKAVNKLTWPFRSSLTLGTFQLRLPSRCPDIFAVAAHLLLLSWSAFSPRVLVKPKLREYMGLPLDLERPDN